MGGKNWSCVCAPPRYYGQWSGLYTSEGWPPGETSSFSRVCVCIWGGGRRAVFRAGQAVSCTFPCGSAEKRDRAYTGGPVRSRRPAVSLFAGWDGVVLVSSRVLSGCSVWLSHQRLGVGVRVPPFGVGGLRPPGGTLRGGRDDCAPWGWIRWPPAHPTLKSLGCGVWGRECAF